MYRDEWFCGVGLRRFPATRLGDTDRQWRTVRLEVAVWFMTLS